LVDQGLSAGNGLFSEVVKVFPNPAADVLWVECGGPLISQISILNLHGKVVLSSENNPGSEKIGMDVSQLMPGLYIVNVRSGKAMVYKRVVIL
jgi:hypothetical protein